MTNECCCGGLLQRRAVGTLNVPDPRLVSYVHRSFVVSSLFKPSFIGFEADLQWRTAHVAPTMLFDLLALSAAVLLSSRTVAAQSGGTPCSSVSSMSTEYMSLFPEATQALVPGQAAEDCLRSVPIDKAEDLALIDELKLFMNWQSKAPGSGRVFRRTC